MTLSSKAKAAREHADVCTDPSCHAVAAALESALDAQAREQLSELAPEHDVEGIPPPPVSEVWIERGGTEN